MKKIAVLIINILLTTVLIAQTPIFTKTNIGFPEIAWGSADFTDFDNDGDIDVLISGRTQNKTPICDIYRNDNGTFTAINAGLEAVYFSSVKFVDFNNDKKSDVIILGRNAENKAVTKTYQNLGNGKFELKNTNLVNLSNGSIDCKDFDNDNKIDILISGKDDNKKAITKIYRNIGNFEFTDINANLTGLYNSSVKWANFNKDSYPDIIICGDEGFSRYTIVYKNNGGNSFQKIKTDIPNVGNSSLDCADFDKDGATDILLTGIDVYGNETTNLLRNTGNFTFVDYKKETRGLKKIDFSLPNVAYGSAIFTDIDEDNDLDILISGKGKKKLTELFINEGNDNFIKANTNFTGVYHSFAFAEDLNNNGKKDIYFSGLDEKKNILAVNYENKGNQTSNKEEVLKKVEITSDFTAIIKPEGQTTKFVNKTESDLESELKYTWDFGDGKTSTLENPVHIYEKAGRYTVVLTAVVGSEVKTKTKAVAIKPSNFDSYNFTDKEKLIINTEAIRLLQKYANLINELGENIAAEEDEINDIKERLINSFISRNVLIFNDLDPDYQLSKFYSIESYASNLIMWYQDGITVELDLNNAKTGKVNQHDKQLFSLDILARKTLDGFYNNRKENKNVEDLSFRIAFSKEGNTIKNFKLVGIREAYSLTPVDITSMDEVNKAEDITENEIAGIQGEVEALLHDYIRSLKLIGNPKEPKDEKELYLTAFQDLFQTKESKLFNDIEIDAEENELTPEQYVTKYYQLYEQGIRNLHLNLDSAEYKPVIKNGDEGFYMYVHTEKRFSGKQNAKDMHTFAEKIIFKVNFMKSGSAFTEFYISSIEISAPDFYQGTGEALNTEDMVLIQPITRNGLSTGFMASGGMGSIYNPNLTARTENTDGYQWTSASEISYTAGFEVNFFYNNNIAFGSGVQYTSYSSKYNLEGEFAENADSDDINGDSFVKNIVASYDSIIEASFLDIPIRVMWLSGNTQKTGIYIEGGLNISFMTKASQSSIGDYRYFGYYENNPLSLQTLDLTELGFYQFSGIDKKYPVAEKTISFSAFLSAGITIPLGYFSTIRVGPEFIFGLTDISANKITKTDIYKNESLYQNTTLRRYGLKLSINYKF